MHTLELFQKHHQICIKGDSPNAIMATFKLWDFLSFPSALFFHFDVIMILQTRFLNPFRVHLILLEILFSISCSFDHIFEHSFLAFPPYVGVWTTPVTQVPSYNEHEDEMKIQELKHIWQVMGWLKIHFT